jgi:hypothetical protein
VSEPISLASARGGSSRIGRRIKIVLASIVVALVLIGQGMVLVRSLGNAGALSGYSVQPTGLQGQTLTHRLDSILGNVLGPSDRGVRRFTIVRISPVAGSRGLKAVTISWAINNDISAGSVGNGAEADVYAVLRGIYTAGLPIALVRLDGTYPTARKTRETTVMRLAMSRKVAKTIANVGWDNMDPQTLWPLVVREYVAPAFQPLSGE